MNAQKHALDEAIIKEKQVTFREFKMLNQHLIEIIDKLAILRELKL